MTPITSGAGAGHLTGAVGRGLFEDEGWRAEVVQVGDRREQRADEPVATGCTAHSVEVIRAI